MSSEITETDQEPTYAGESEDPISPTSFSLQKALETARGKLLDRSLRNKLISTNLAFAARPSSPRVRWDIRSRVRDAAGRPGGDIRARDRPR